MGFRTVVLLYNDQASEWEKDPELGKKISIGMNYTSTREADHYSPANLGYGKVVECTHADTQTLAVLGSYGFDPITYGMWRSVRTKEERNLQLLESAARKLGGNQMNKRKLTLMIF